MIDGLCLSMALETTTYVHRRHGAGQGREANIHSAIHIDDDWLGLRLWNTWNLLKSPTRTGDRGKYSVECMHLVMVGANGD
jgi:hypothetical protein